jgi:prophage regulatory protein
MQSATVQGAAWFDDYWMTLPEPGTVGYRVLEFLRAGQFSSRADALEALTQQFEVEPGRFIGERSARLQLQRFSGGAYLTGWGSGLRPRLDAEQPAALPQVQHILSNLDLPDCEYIRQAELLKILPFSSSTLYRMVLGKEFPSPMKLSARVKAWRVVDVRHWLDAKTSVPASRLADSNPQRPNA